MDKKLRRALKYFYIDFNARTEGLSFFVIVPAVIFFVWGVVQLTPEQFVMFNKIWPIAFVFGIAFVLVNNWIVLIPVLRYFRKLLRDQPVAPEEYARAKKRFLMLPYIHAVGAFFRWIILMGNAIVPSTLLADLTGPQAVIMWIGAGICSIIGIFTYFSITELRVQRLLGSGLFALSAGIKQPPRLQLQSRLIFMAVGAVLLPFAIFFAFFYITVENYNIASGLMYMKVGFIAVLSMFAGIFSPVILSATIRDKAGVVVSFLKEIGSGNLSAGPQDVAIEDEISEINYEVDDMRGRLKSARDELMELNLTLEQKVDERTEELRAAMEELEAINENLINANRDLEHAEEIHKKDLAMAASIQETFLPKTPPGSAHYDIAYAFRPMAGVSGDFYDFYEEHGILDGVGLFDVSGHGIASGLLTLIAKSIIQRNFSNLKKEKLNRVMEQINRELIDEIGQSDNYITGILIRFTGDRIEYVNSGHPDMLFRVGATKKAGHVVDRTGGSVRGMFLGVAAMDKTFEVLSLKMSSGDTLFLFSDCFIEAVNSSGQAYGDAGLLDSLKNAPEGSAQKILNHILNDFYNYMKDRETFGDDLTAIVINRK